MESVWGKSKDQGAAKPGSESYSELIPLEKLILGKRVLGPKVTVNDLKGKPAMILFWNATSESSLSSFVKLNAWDSELSDFGLISVAVHLTGVLKNAEGLKEAAQDQSEIENAAKSHDVAFAVTQQPWTEDSPVKETKEFPLCVVFDHEGHNTFHGSPFDAETAMREAVGKTLVAAAGKTTFSRNVAPLVDSLRKGKSPTAVLPRLVVMSRSNDDETASAAKSIIAKVTEAGWKVLRDTEALIQDDPVASFLKLERLPAIYPDTALASKATQLLAKLKQDKQEGPALRTLAAVKKLDRDLASRPGNAALLVQLRNNIRSMQRSWPDGKATKEAIRVGEKYGISVP